MQTFQFSEATESLFKELDQLNTENLDTCKEDCRNNYRTCVDSGNDKWECGQTLDSCLHKCYKANPEASVIIKKIVGSL